MAFSLILPESVFDNILLCTWLPLLDIEHYKTVGNNGLYSELNNYWLTYQIIPPYFILKKERKKEKIRHAAETLITDYKRDRTFSKRIC